MLAEFQCKLEKFQEFGIPKEILPNYQMNIAESGVLFHIVGAKDEQDDANVAVAILDFRSFENELGLTESIKYWASIRFHENDGIARRVCSDRSY